MSLTLELEACYQPNWLSARRANALKKALAAMTYREYSYRASALKRAPKREFFVPFADGASPVYRWGQNRTEYSSGLPMSEIPRLDAVRQQIAAEFGEACNHCIVIEYSDGDKHHAPPHHDRQEGVDGNGARDMVAGSSFFVVTLGYARPFQLLDRDHNLVWEEALPHGSLLQVTAEMNREFYHAVPRDPAQPRAQPRYSAIFRTIRAASRELAAVG